MNGRYGGKMKALTANAVKMIKCTDNVPFKRNEQWIAVELVSTTPNKLCLDNNHGINSCIVDQCVCATEACNHFYTVWASAQTMINITVRTMNMNRNWLIATIFFLHSYFALFSFLLMLLPFLQHNVQFISTWLTLFNELHSNPCLI